MATKAESHKIADYVAKYSNASSGAGYKSAVETFLRSTYNLPKKDKDGKRVTYDFESLLTQYLDDKTRNNSADIKAFSEYLAREAKSKQSARQVLTYAAKFLRSYGITVLQDDVQDIKREMKGGAATVAKSLTGDMICLALRGANVRDRAAILTMASSGLRVGELLSLDMKDIDLDSTPVKITIRAAKSKNKHARFTFCSNEARDAIRLWLKNRDAFLKESAKHNQNLIEKGVKTAPVKTASTLLFPVSDSQVNSSWESCLKKAGLYVVDAETNRNVYRLHALRKFFYSKLSNSETMPEKLALYFVGHLTDLGNKYYIPTEEYAAAEYLKVQDALLCCRTEADKTTIAVLEHKTEALQKDTAELKQDKQEQRESIEYLRETNNALAVQMKSMQEQMNVLTDSMELLFEMTPEDFKTQFKKDAAHGAEVARTLKVRGKK